MADLTSAEATADPCCAPAQQATCCEPSAKAECCDHGDGCDCDAGSTTAPAGDVREHAAAATIRAHKPAQAT
jgi:hypothetical protein